MNKSTLLKLRSDLGKSLSKIMINDLGFEPDEIEDYCRIDIIPSENRIEVGAEVDYEELEMITEGLNKVIEKYDEDAYFEPQVPGITVAYIDMSSNKITAEEDISNDEDYFDLDLPEQEFDSANTSINSNKLPAVYRMIQIPEGTVGVDFGGGKFDNSIEYVKDIGATLVVYDPYNRSAQHNREVIKMLKENGGADWAVNSNVLNVIKEPDARKAVLENISKITKSGAPIYITVYEGRGDGKEGQTKSGYQLNKKTEDYLEDIQEVFPDAKRRGKLITAHNVRSIDSSINSSTDGFVYTYCDICGKKNRVEVHFKDYKSPFDDTEFDCKYCGAHNLLIDPHEYDDEGYVI